jgi:hypothetical protein
MLAKTVANADDNMRFIVSATAWAESYRKIMVLAEIIYDGMIPVSLLFSSPKLKEKQPIKEPHTHYSVSLRLGIL